MGTLLYFQALRCTASAEDQVVNGVRRRRRLAARASRPRLACRSSAAGGAGIRERSYDGRELRQVFWRGRRWCPSVLGTGAGSDEAEGEGRHG